MDTIEPAVLLDMLFIRCRTSSVIAVLNQPRTRPRCVQLVSTQALFVCWYRVAFVAGQHGSGASLG